MERKRLVSYQTHASVSISRISPITMMVLTNARAAFSYSGASGFRDGYASYNGQWYITCPIGQDAVVQFSAHGSHKKDTDLTYPSTFMQRPKRCTQMVAVIAAPSGLQLAFCGRKPAGTCWNNRPLLRELKEIGTALFTSRLANAQSLPCDT